MSVSYTTMDGYPQGRWIRGDFFGTTKLKCEWHDSDNLLNEINTSPWWPSEYGFGPTSAVAYDASVEPFAVQTGTGATSDYNYALVTVKYTTRGPEWVAGHGSITETFSAAAMALPVAEDVLYWADGTPLNPNEIENPVLYVQEWRIKWDQIADPVPVYWAAVIGSSLVGCTNSNQVWAFTSSQSFAAGTLRFIPPTIQTTFGIGTAARKTVTLTLQYHPYGWNYFWNTKLGGFYAVYSAAGIRYTPYTPSTFPSRL